MSKEVNQLVEVIHQKLQAKTNWGRNELKKLIAESVASLPSKTPSTQPDCFDPRDPLNFEAHWCAQ